MTDSTPQYINSQSVKKLLKRKRVQASVADSLKRRHRAELRLKCYGMFAIVVSFLFLILLFTNIISNGYLAFVTTKIALQVDVTHELVEKGKYRKIMNNALKEMFPDVTGRKDRRRLSALVSRTAQYHIEDYVAQNPQMVGQRVDIWVLASSDVDMLYKGKIKASTPEHLRRLNDQQLAWLDSLQSNDKVKTVFNTTFFTSGDSRDPEAAGILGSFVGSVLVIISCMMLAFPLGVLTAIYLEEFAPKNKFTDLIEVNINNLAAVPSIVFGLLGLSIYLQVFGVPRSASLAGGLTLALMALPIIVIATRTSIRAIPQSIRDGAIALGASKVQTTMHHVLPLAMPGIMTGTILSVARVLGETAPLLMIGMVAFIVDIPKNFTDAATAMPVQIYLWSDSPELGFAEKTSAAIIVLLILLLLANSLAVYLRKKFEIRW